jgi:hypothetical protein
MNRRTKALEKQDWLEEGAPIPLSADPLGSIFERSRAERQGVAYTPEKPLPPLIVSVSPSPAVLSVASPDVSMGEFIAAANRNLSPSAFKVLLAVYVQGEGRYHASDLARLTFLNKDTVNNAVHECLVKGWFTRRSECPQCGTEAVLEDKQKMIVCTNCGRTTSPQHLYSIHCPDGISVTPDGNPATHSRIPATPP